MTSLSAKIAVLLGAVFVVVTALLVVAMQADAARARLLSFEGLIGVLGVGLLAAWFVLRSLAHRIARVSDAVDSMVKGGLSRPLRLAEANAYGDELAQLAARAERVSEHVAEQSVALAKVARQRRELLANVSHDLRTPLASMQGYLELLLLRQGSLEPAEANNYLQTAARQSERLGRLVGDLFELTRLEGDDAQLELEPFVLAELAQDVVQRFAPAAQARDVALRACSEYGEGGAADAPGHVVVQADIGLIERVLGNLVDNALRHTPAGGAVNITIGADERCARLAVRDTGAGIAADELPGIFERYERASRVGDTSVSHAGLGLAIARRIVHLHGSNLQVNSVAGEGTCVSFELARAQPCAGLTGLTGRNGIDAAPRGRGLPV